VAVDFDPSGCTLALRAEMQRHRAMRGIPLDANEPRTSARTRGGI
jgi:hypothetical protein